MFKTKLQSLLNEIQNRQSAVGRSPEGRTLAVLATDTQKLLAWANFHNL